MDNSDVNKDLIRDHVDTIILSTLENEDRYGLDILEVIQKNSKGLYELKQPTLYSCLKRLEKLGYIRSYKGDSSNGAQRVYYTLLDDGRKFLENDKYQWEYSRTIINGLLSAKDFDPEEKPPFEASELRPRTKRNPRSNPTAEEAADVGEMPILLVNNDTNESGEDDINPTVLLVRDEDTPSSSDSIENQPIKKTINGQNYTFGKDTVIYEQDVDYVNTMEDIFSNSNKNKFEYASPYNTNQFAPPIMDYAEQYSLESLQKTFASQGFIIKPYIKKNTTEYYVNKYIYINRILGATAGCAYALYAVLLCFLHIVSASALKTSAGSLFIALGLGLLVPVAFAINYIINPNKRIAANFNLKKTFMYTLMFMVNILLAIIIIGFGVFKATFVNPISIVKPIVFPIIMLLTIPADILIYSWLYHSTRFHVN